MKGEFEALRSMQNKFKRIDPINNDKSQKNEYMNTHQIAKLLYQPDEDLLANNPDRFNNSLYQGERGQGGQIRIKIMGKGHLVGWEDIMAGRKE